MIDEEEMMPQVNPGRISITRNILVLSRVLDRLPPALLHGEETEWDQPISLMVTNEPVGNQGDTANVPNPNAADSTVLPMVPYLPTARSSFVRGKRQRPKYSLNP